MRGLLGLFPLLFASLAWALTYEEALSLTKNGMLHLTEENYHSYIKNNDFNLVVLLTATDPRIKCKLCVEFEPIYKQVAAKYAESITGEPIPADETSRLILAHSEYTEARTYFTDLGLTSVPKVYHYAPGLGPKMTQFSNDFMFMTEDNVEAFQRWLTEVTPGLAISDLKFMPKMSIGSILTPVFSIFAIGAIAYYKSNFFLKLFGFKKLWQTLSLILILIFVSGQMYNQIRGAASNKNGDYFQVGHNTQFAIESQVIGSIYLFLTISLLTLLHAKSGKVGMLVVIFACGLSIGLFSGLINAYSIKSPGYPFRVF
ncbi:dolichyl-diphosphooligosaccharide--protein glycotransferase [Martiniozyma asiatica (nom. inval.)]|nr:dolichyl-diphosphooligosaccharide--protein glycotransferase [Martiniozyma asiatica]